MASANAELAQPGGWEEAVPCTPQRQQGASQHFKKFTQGLMDTEKQPRSYVQRSKDSAWKEGWNMECRGHAVLSGLYTPHHHRERPEDTGCVLGGGSSRSLRDDADQWVQGISGVPATILQQRLHLHTPTFTFWEIVEEDKEMCPQHPGAAGKGAAQLCAGRRCSRAQAEMTRSSGGGDGA